jgi:hypothetical protein
MQTSFQSVANPAPNGATTLTCPTSLQSLNVRTEMLSANGTKPICRRPQ